MALQSMSTPTYFVVGRGGREACWVSTGEVGSSEGTCCLGAARSL